MAAGLDEAVFYKTCLKEICVGLRTSNRLNINED